MKRYTIFLFTLLAVLASCSSDDDDDNGGGSQNANSNANPAIEAAYSRLEMPHVKDGSRILIHTFSSSQYGFSNTVNYITEWDDQLGAQRWSAYVMDKTMMQSHTKRYESSSNQYPFDPLLPEAVSPAKDYYWRSGYDHGHICPSADRLCTREANIQTFYLTNMQPQIHAFNTGVWEEMETKVRNLAKQNDYTWCDELYVCKGGTIDGGSYGGKDKVYKTISGVLPVPRYFFMALLREKTGTDGQKHYNAMAFWIDQTVSRYYTMEDLSQFAITIDELEYRTGIDFFCNLPDDIENKVEATAVSPALWGLQ